MAAPMYNVYVGAETGLLKGINVKKSHWDNLNAVEKADKSREIISVSWVDEKQKELCIGLKNHTVQVYDIFSKLLTSDEKLEAGEGNLRNVDTIGDRFVTSVESGTVKCWEEGEVTSEWEAGKDLFVHNHNPQQKQLFVTGGKENELKLWSMEREKIPLFTAKNVKNDWLNLRVPVWVLGAVFIPNSEKIVSCTGHHQIRMYDPKAQRRPVLDMEFDEYPITAMSLCPQSDTSVVVGNTHGTMGTIDLRKGRMVNLFKGIGGGIRDIRCHQTMPIVASCGLDRYLRIHDLNTKALLHKFYLKSRLNCIVLSRRWELDDFDGDESCTVLGAEDLEVKTEPQSDTEEDLWDKMEIVHTKTKRKHEKECDKQENSKKNKTDHVKKQKKRKN